jgi:hypothetical protein
VNLFAWPSKTRDLRRDALRRVWWHGPLPPKLTAAVGDKLLELARSRRLKQAPRTTRSARAGEGRSCRELGRGRIARHRAVNVAEVAAGIEAIAHALL